MKEQILIREGGSADWVKIVESSCCGGTGARLGSTLAPFRGRSGIAGTLRSVQMWTMEAGGGEQEVLRGRGSTQETGATQV